MKIIKLEDIPIEMTFENIDILAKMMSAFPPIQEWRDISSLITDENWILISCRVSEINEEKRKQRWESLTIEEQEKEKQSIERSLDEESSVYRGNILQQEWDSMNLERIEREEGAKEK